MLKLQCELEGLTQKMAVHKAEIENHAKWLRENGDYNDFATRLAGDCKYAYIGSATVCEWYDKYKCNDTHVNNLVKTALRNIGILSSH